MNWYQAYQVYHVPMRNKNNFLAFPITNWFQLVIFQKW